MQEICPAYAGMIPVIINIDKLFLNLSRVCGDDPQNKKVLFIRNSFVPRMRGWSQVRLEVYCSTVICPAYAGMILRGE